MMKECGLMLAAMLLLLGCEHMPMSEISQKPSVAGDANVTISVGSVEQYGNETTSRSLVAVSEVCSRLGFGVYKDGEKVKTVNQVKDDADFGTVSLKLDAGKYQILALAHSAKKNVTITNPEKIQFTNPETASGTGFSDTFYYYGDLEVTAEASQHQLTLRRATAMFRFVTTDVKPAKVRRFQFYYEGGSGALNAVTGLGCVNSKQSVFFDVDSSLDGQTLSFDLYTFLHDETGRLEFLVKAFDANEDVLYKRTFQDVPMERNTITLYSGKFFVNNTGGDDTPPDTPPAENPLQGHSILVDPEWAATNMYSF